VGEGLPEVVVDELTNVGSEGGKGNRIDTNLV
jgi:hypothetical protein